MSTIEQLISDLLLRHSCVVVPSFGGFVAKQASAVIDYKSGVMFPPKKSLLFNRKLINNDGLLIAELATRENISFEAASKKLGEKVETWKSALQQGERIVLDRVGYLFFDQEKNICFEQDRFFNLLLESYGLGKVHFLTETDVALVEQKVQATENTIPVSFEKEKALDFNTDDIEIEKAPKSERKTVLIEHPETTRRFNWKYAAAVAFIPLAFYTYWLPMKTGVLESGIISTKDFNPFYHSGNGAYEVTTWERFRLNIPKHESLEKLASHLPKDVRVISYQFDEDLYIPVKLPVVELEEKGIVPLAEKVEISEKTVRGNMDYIVGCFNSPENAENLIATLKKQGLKAYQVDIKDGLYRVSAGNTNSLAGLAKIIKVSADAGFEGWMLKK
jgi:hypothetical protein